MKNRFLILFVAAATLFACSGDSMISDDFNETAEKQPPINFKAKKLVGNYEFGPEVNTSINCNATTGLKAEGEGTVSGPFHGVRLVRFFYRTNYR